MKRYHVIDYGVPRQERPRFTVTRHVLFPDMLVDSFKEIIDAATLSEALNDKPALLEEFRKKEW